MKTVITLGDMQAKGMRMLEVACQKCARRGRLSIARLIAEHGRDNHSDLCALIAHDRPRMQDLGVSIYERCGVHFPAMIGRGPRGFHIQIQLESDQQNRTFVVCFFEPACLRKDALLI